jgi:peroxin-2
MASLANLLVFLSEGKHPTLVDRILGLKPVSVAPSGQDRTVGYSYMTRELLWHGFIVSTVHSRDIII